MIKQKKLDEEKGISYSVKQGTESLKAKAAEIDQQYKISEKASTTSRSIGEQWNQVDEKYNVSRNASTASSSISETMSEWGSTVAQGLADTLQTPAVQNTLSSMSEWTNNVGRSIGAFLQPAADTVTREYNDIKDQSTREINAKQMERAHAQEGIQMDELSDLNLNDDAKKSEPAPVPLPAEIVDDESDVSKIPPPEEPNTV